VIGTAIGGAGEIFREAQNSLTFGPGDSELLASRMYQLQQDAKLRCEIAEAGQQEVMSQFNESAVTDKIETYLQTALSGQPE
jgi:glycosyltransferase involved in cell wall biosynthesis